MFRDNLDRSKRLVYITDLAPTRSGGGSYAVNWHIQEQLAKHFDLHTPKPIVPAISSWEKFLSRVQRRILRRPGKFFYFSSATLDSNARRVAGCIRDNADGIFFRSATRWCHFKPNVPYFVYMDVVFKTYFENTFDSAEFVTADLARIFVAEKGFLEGASAVFFESQWGLEKAMDAYGLTGDHYFVASRGGVIEPPSADIWSDDPPFLLSVAMKFEQKGGDLILAAFRRLRELYPTLRWHIVGGKPTGDWESVDGIVYEGVLSPDEPDELARFRQLFAKAFLFVHPTREDTNPLVITEAAYFGCPTISVKRFAIPELTLDGETGVLLDSPVRPQDLVEAIHRLIADPVLYRRLRQGAFQFSRSHFDWDRIGAQIAKSVGAVLA